MAPLSSHTKTSPAKVGFWFNGSIVKARIESHLKIVGRLGEKDTASMLLKTRQAMRNIRFRELLYVDISGHWLNFHLYNGETVAVYASLKDYEDTLLSEACFACCHQSFIVNMDHVAVVEVRDILMKNGAHLPISKKYLGFKKEYAEWISC